MTQDPLPDPERPPVLAIAATVLGLLAGAVAAIMVLGLIGLGVLTEGGPTDALWLAGLLAAAVAQLWGVVRLLRRRGWLLLALGSLPGVLPAVALVGVWLEYGEGLSTIAALAAIPLLALACTLTPAVRSWAAPRPTPASTPGPLALSDG